MKTFKQFITESMKDMKEQDDAYEAFFQATLKKFGVDSPEDLDKEKKKEFFDYIDKNWKADNEEKITEANTDMYSWEQINKALMSAGIKPALIGDVLKALKKA